MVGIMRSVVVVGFAGRSGVTESSRRECPCHRVGGTLIHCVKCCDQPGWSKSTATEAEAETIRLDQAIESHFTLLSIPRKESDKKKSP